MPLMTACRRVLWIIHCWVTGQIPSSLPTQQATKGTFGLKSPESPLPYQHDPPYGPTVLPTVDPIFHFRAVSKISLRCAMWARRAVKPCVDPSQGSHASPSLPPTPSPPLPAPETTPPPAPHPPQAPPPLAARPAPLAVEGIGLRVWG